jgi:hypothetical protein
MGSLLLMLLIQQINGQSVTLARDTSRRSPSHWRLGYEAGDSPVLASMPPKSYSPSMPHPPNPLFGPNRFNLGIFSANCDGGDT